MAIVDRTKTLLAFMTDAPEGTYEAPKPTDEQLAAVLPWMVDETIRWARRNGHCETVGAGIANLVGVSDGELRRKELKFYAADGRDCNGFDRDGRDADGYDVYGYDVEGFNKHGFNRDGYDKNGFSRYGYDKEGFDVNGCDRYGKTRAEHAAALVGGWSKEHLAVVAAKLAERQAKAAAEAVDKAEPEPVEAAEVQPETVEETVPVAA